MLPLVLSAACAPQPEPADLMVHGGSIHTSDRSRSEASVLVVREGRVVAVGGQELRGRFSAAREMDLAGRTVIPGLIDAHAHFLGLGEQAERLELRDCRSFAEVVARVKAAVGKARPGEFILGRGWNQELWPDEQLPTHGELSLVSPDNPVLLRRVDGHATLANAKAMELSGITKQSEVLPGGDMLRDASGEPTGVFVDMAVALLVQPPPPDGATLERRALLAQSRCLAVGLTGVHDAGVDEQALQLFERLYDEGRLHLRMNAMLSADFDASGAPAPWLAARLARGPQHGARGGRLSVTAVKIYADGALGSRGAALLAPYADRPDTSGLMQLSRESLVTMVRAARAAGFQAATHAIGDAANRMALDAYAEVLGDDAKQLDARFRIEHAQVIALADIPRFRALGVIASVQPTHATSDMNMAEERIGPDRLKGAYAWRRLSDSGAHLALGSDFPVESENPFWGLHAAETRTDRSGQPPGGWEPQERLSREEALRGFTADAAWAGFDEKDLGSLTPGKFADFLVLPEDPLTCPPERLATLQPDETWIAGERLYTRLEK